jgi:CubicO group peptidase (beta-lactamase class C family)
MSGASLASLSLGFQTSLAQSNITNLDSMLEPIREQFSIPALTAGMIRGSDLVALGSIGIRSAESAISVAAEDLWHLGSCTKSMTATLTALLVEEGVLSWDTTIADVYPDLLNVIFPEYRFVTPVQLMSHRAGIPGINTPIPYDEIQGRYWTFSGPITQQRESLVSDVLSRAPVSTPGTIYNYSNLGYIIVGSMLERLTGKTWEDLMIEKLFAPLEMFTASFGAPGNVGQTDQPWGHTSADCTPIAPGIFADNAPILGPAGRVHCSMQDWAKYAALHLQGSRGLSNLLLPSEQFFKLHQDQAGQGYGLGWEVSQRDWAGGTTLSHSGSNTMWMAVIWIAPQQDAAFISVANCGSGEAFSAVDSAVAAMIERFLD